MSASSKKKLRKEQKAVAMTERQNVEKKEAKKLKRNTILFVAAISLVLVAFVGILAWQWISGNGLFQKSTTAAVVNGKELNSVEFNYYYVDTAMEEYNQMYTWYSYFGEDAASMIGLDTSKPLNKQTNEQTGETWSRYILNSALANAKEDAALVSAAKKAGHKLSQEDKDTLKSYSKNLDANAKNLGYPDADALLARQYGKGAEKDTYLKYLEKTMLADSYKTAYNDGLTFDDAAIREHDAKDPLKFNSYDYTYYYVSSANYMPEETTTEPTTEATEPTTEATEPTTEATEPVENEQNEADKEAASREKAKEVADQLGTAKTLEELTAAVKELEVKGKKDQSVTTSHNVLYTNVTAAMKDWVTNAERKAGDITVIPNESTDSETNETVINGYYVVCYEGSSTNDLGKMTNVRHLLVSFPEATEEESHEGHDHEAETTEPTTEATDPTTETTEPTTETTEHHRSRGRRRCRCFRGSQG